MVLKRVKYPPGALVIKSIGAGTVSVVEGSAAIIVFEVGSFARKNMERQAARVVFALTLYTLAPACKCPNP